MGVFRTQADIKAIEAEADWEARDEARTLYQFLTRAKAAHGDRPAVTFQLQASPGARAQTLTWAQLHGQVTRAANLFRSLGVGPKDVVAFVLPNSLETVVTLLGGAVAGIVSPINPLLEPAHIAGILRETGAKVVVTLRAFPKTELPQRVAEAVALAPGDTTVVEVDLAHYLGVP
ncbi:MAG: AMP-binding protein, partial [Candidatus Saccharibacteria bacterium]|nr:AMP-binding protein [Pseudorhodobacter sp.]